MKQFVVLLLVSFTLSGSVAAQGSFRFREIYSLERRVARGGEDYQFAREASYHGLATPSAANRFIVDPNDPISYRDENRMLTLLSEIDYIAQSGRLDESEKQFNRLLQGLHRAQGENSYDEGFVLDHIALYYLKFRDFDLAYKRLSEAVKITRTNITARPEAVVPLRLHLADLLTSMGELDAARGEALEATDPDKAKRCLDLAEHELHEAVAIDNEQGYRIYVNRLDGPYFESVLLEHEKRWAEAEQMWAVVVDCRAKTGNQPYWDALREMAAFEARKGDFAAGAKLAKQVLEAPKQMNVASPAPYWLDSRAIGNTRFMYEAEADIAMREILAVDAFLTKGTEAAAPLLKTPIESWMLDRGDDAARLRYLSWLSDKTSLHLSILLDSKATDDRITESFALVGSVQGRYLAATAASIQTLRSEVGNPNIQDPNSGAPEDLAEARQRRAHLFVTEEVDGKPINPHGYAAVSTEEQALTESILGNLRFRMPDLSLNKDNHLANSLAPDAALINFISWNRLDRAHPGIRRREYGAFIVRNGQPIKYSPIGAVDAIDQQIEALVHVAKRVLDDHDDSEGKNAAPILRDLYGKILAPLEGNLAGARTILIISDGRLALVPFAALIDRQGNYFLKSHVVSYLTSWRDVVTQTPEVQSEIAPLVLANPDFDMTLADSTDPKKNRPIHLARLKGAEEEAFSVQTELALPKERVLIGQSAREGIVESVRGPQILHFATHSVAAMDVRSPGESYDLFEFPGPSSIQNPLLLSVVALAGANRPQEGIEDGLLTGLEIASLNLTGTRLVVLSSCESGGGQIVDGQGVIGLRSAFLMAGAQSLIMNIWPVSEKSSPVFMQSLYKHLKTSSIPEAVRLAQMDLLAKPPFNNPLFWGGYAQTGTYVASIPEQQTAVAQRKDPANYQSDSFVAPVCYEFSGRAEKNVVNQFKLQIRIGGSVDRQAVSPETIVYDLSRPGNEVKLSSDYESPWRSSEHPPTTLRIERTKDHSGMYLNAGSTTKLSVILEGDPGLFSSLDLPRILPPKTSYKKMSISHSRVSAQVIDYVGVCQPDMP